MGHIPSVQVQVVRCAMRRFEDSKILAFEVRVPLAAAIDSEKKRQIGIATIGRPLLAQVELSIPGIVAKKALSRLYFSS